MEILINTNTWGINEEDFNNVTATKGLDRAPGSRRTAHHNFMLRNEIEIDMMCIIGQHDNMEAPPPPMGGVRRRRR